MTNLTDKWKKGELPRGWYWVDYYSVDGAVMLEYIPQHNGFGYEEKELVQAVLAEVPSYEQWQKHRKTLLKTQEKNCDLEIINTQLKSLLKECRDEINPYIEVIGGKKTFKNLIKKIDEVLE